MDSSAVVIDDIEAYLRAHEQKDLLRFITCGSVDDGKSTLIGRLLHETDNVFIDQANALMRDSLRTGNAGDGEIDYSLLLDGLKAEREQGITIDVAYRYFNTQKRKYIIADCPGHEQYTRNMITGGSTAHLAIVLIDARHGVLTQTRRHSYICNLLGIKHVVVAVNKLDLRNYSQEVFDQITADYKEFVQSLPNSDTEYSFIPLSALRGDNVTVRSEETSWYEGPTLLETLESVSTTADRSYNELFYPVQYVLRPDLNFRGFCGTIASGIVKKGQRIRVLPSGKESTVKSITNFEGELEQAFVPQAVTVSLNDEIDISRGDVIVDENASPHVGIGLEAMLVWMTEDCMELGKQYLVKLLCNTVPGQVTAIDHRLDVNTLDHDQADGLELNEIAKVHIKLNRSVVFDIYRKNKQAGAFIIIDRITNNTVGAGMITGQVPYEADHTRNLATGRSAGDEIAAVDRAARHNQKPAVVWMSSSDETQALAVAHELEKNLFDDGFLPYVLDFHNLSVDMKRLLEPTAGSHREGQRWALALSRLSADAGMIAIAVVGEESKGDEAGLSVYVDDQPLANPETKVIDDESVPQLTFPDGGADTRHAASSIADYLRREGIVGFYRNDDMVVF